jgi:hypothetical protein
LSPTNGTDALTLLDPLDRPFLEFGRIGRLRYLHVWPSKSDSILGRPGQTKFRGNLSWSEPDSSLQHATVAMMLNAYCRPQPAAYSLSRIADRRALVIPSGSQQNAATTMTFRLSPVHSSKELETKNA